MASRSTMSALLYGLLGALMTTALLVAYETGRSGSTAPADDAMHAALDGREVFDSEGVTLGVVEQTVSGRQGERSARYAMVRMSSSGHAGLRLAVPASRLQVVEDGLQLNADDATIENDGEFMPAVADRRSRT